MFNNETKMRKRKFIDSLYWKIGATFLFILIILSAVYLYISVFTAEMYFQEANQKLNSDIAPHIANENKCFVNGKVNEDVLKNVFHNVMIINPSIEVYLLDTKGNILTYFAPEKEIKLNFLPLEPIQKYIEGGGKTFVMGPDPKNENREKAFSAAKVYEGKNLCGYIYVVLESEEYDNATQMVFGSYIMRLGFRSMIITLLAAALISLIALGFIIRNMRKIISAIREFKNGNLKARVKLKGKGELSEFADNYNEMADTIVRNIEDMKTMDNLRRELVANVSHDLRTPLASIQGYIETILMKSETLSEDDRTKYMQTILSSTERLKKLVEELFELSKLEARETKPKPEAFSIAELAQDVQQKNLIIAKNKNIELTTTFPYDLPLAFADIRMMEKVLQNLIENSIKYTNPDGKINIQLKNENEEILVSVKDTGVGISPNDIEHIFDRYKQGKRTKQNDGVGLGLAIVHKILEVHEIKISVNSNPGEGSTFYFKIPTYKTGIKAVKNFA